MVYIISIIYIKVKKICLQIVVIVLKLYMWVWLKNINGGKIMKIKMITTLIISFFIAGMMLSSIKDINDSNIEGSNITLRDEDPGTFPPKIRRMDLVSL